MNKELLNKIRLLITLENDSNKRLEMLREVERYVILLKDRIDKAVEYMNEYNEFVVPDANIKSLIIKEEYKKVIKILKGVDNE